MMPLSVLLLQHTEAFLVLNSRRGTVPMITKRVDLQKGRVQVTFELPASIWAAKIALVGDFNDRNTTSQPRVQTRKNENWHVTVSLMPGQAYRFQYLIDDRFSTTDSHADAYAATEDGRHCFIIYTEPIEAPIAYPGRGGRWAGALVGTATGQ